MQFIKGRVAAVAVGASILVALGGAGGAMAASQIGSHGIKDNSVRSVDIKNDTLRMQDFRPAVRSAIRAGGVEGAEGPQGPAGPAGADGQDGISDVAAGAHYRTTWAANSFGETITSCPAGEYALGGGYSTFGGYPTNGSYDLGGQNTDIQVTVSAPYFPGEYEPISETDSRFRPTQWVVRGFNAGDTAQVVRAWVICAGQK